MSVSNLGDFYDNSKDYGFKPDPCTAEIEFASEAFSSCDVHQSCGFADYLSPNEGSPQGIQEHLASLERGVVVSTGTERSFFNLLFVEDAACECLVVRDINPKVKAYVDFNTLLLRISKTRHEYCQLSAFIPHEAHRNFAERLTIIQKKLQDSDFPKTTQQYFLKCMNDFGAIYLHTAQDWRADCYFQECWYHQSEEQFSKLQKYAKSGNIISTIGDINDLKFLRNRKVIAVDTSNICDYQLIHLKGEGYFNPRVIWTNQDSSETTYHSCFYNGLNEKENEEFEDLLTIFKQTEWGDPANMLGETFTQAMRLLSPVLPGYSKATLSVLRDYINETVLQDPHLGIISFGLNNSNCNRINQLTLNQIEILCCNPGIQRFVSNLVNLRSVLKPSHYLAFMQVPGWKEEFEAFFESSFQDLPGFLENLKENGLLDQFIQVFGSERLKALSEFTYSFYSD